MNKFLSSFNIKGGLPKNFKRYYELYILILPALAFFLVFKYLPMYGVQIAFKDFMANLGIEGSPWVGFEHFQRFFKSYTFWTLLENTLGISFYQLAVGFPAPIIVALLLNEIRNRYYKKTVQMIIYVPHFISVVVMSGMIVLFLSPTTGVINQIIGALGGEPVNFLLEPKLFKSIYVFSDLWQNLGWSAVIYIAALSGIDVQLIEAAIMDGANKIRRVWHVNIPAITPIIIVLLIMRVGHIMDVGWQKILLLQNDLNMSSSDVISTYVYRVGVLQAEYSFTAAIGLFNSIVNLILLVTVNTVARRLNETSLW